MAENSAIEWTDHTFNPWIGCTMVAPECTNCYAKTLMDDRYKKAKWGPKGTRVLTSADNWKQPAKWNKKAEKAGVRARVFCASLADVFEDDREIATGDLGIRAYLSTGRKMLWELIDETPNLIWLLLTKRPQNIRAMVPAAWLAQWPENVWTGTSAGCQQTADAMVPALLGVPGPHFLSCEPLLGAVDLFKHFTRFTTTHMSLNVEGAIRNKAFDGFDDDEGNPLSRQAAESELRALQAKGVKVLPLGKCPTFDPVSGCPGHPKPRIDGVICGGESGPNARPMHPDWARRLRDQCAAAGVPFLFKQWGEFEPFESAVKLPMDMEDFLALMKKGGGRFNPAGEWFEGEINTETGGQTMLRVGKKAAGRVLDGVTHDGLPEAFTAKGAAA